MLRASIQLGDWVGHVRDYFLALPQAIASPHTLPFSTTEGLKQFLSQRCRLFVASPGVAKTTVVLTTQVAHAATVERKTVLVLSATTCARSQTAAVLATTSCVPLLRVLGNQKLSALEQSLTMDAFLARRMEAHANKVTDLIVELARCATTALSQLPKVHLDLVQARTAVHCWHQASKMGGSHFFWGGCG